MQCNENSIPLPCSWLQHCQYIKEVVATRKLPPGRRGAVVMKLDVEGQEMEIMADLVMSGALAHLDNVHVDWDTLTIKEEDYQKFDEDVVILDDTNVINFRWGEREMLAWLKCLAGTLSSCSVKFLLSWMSLTAQKYLLWMTKHLRTSNIIFHAEKRCYDNVNGT